MLIVHACDFTGHDTLAVLHAAALASRGARLITLHAGKGDREPSPSAPEFAARWGRQIDRELVRIAIDADEVSDGAADSLIDALRELRPELVVVGTHARRGVAAVETLAPALCVTNGASFRPRPRDDLGRSAAIETFFVHAAGSCRQGLTNRIANDPWPQTENLRPCP